MKLPLKQVPTLFPSHPTAQRVVHFGSDGFDERRRRFLAGGGETGNEEEEESVIDFLFLDADIVQDATQYQIGICESFGEDKRVGGRNTMLDE